MILWLKSSTGLGANPAPHSSLCDLWPVTSSVDQLLRFKREKIIPPPNTDVERINRHN